MVTETRSASETRSLARKIAAKLKKGDVLALTGPLGAGKTTFIQGLAEGLKVKEAVTSPTFVLINEYQGRLPLYHIDLYRLEDPEQIEELGLDEYFEKEGITVIEWADRLGKELPEDVKAIKIDPISENERKIYLSSELAVRLRS